VGEVVQIAVGDAHTCALRRDRTVWCWGPMRTLGSADVDVRTPFWIPELHDVVEIGSGIVHVCARTSSGDVLCWGDNTHGQLGDGSTVSRSVPVRFGG
jgi:alpha-tubulin suppressor-like RCC1 family protein